MYGMFIDFCTNRHKTRTLSHGTPWNIILMAQLDMYVRHLSICYQYMPLAQHEPLRFQTLCYIIMRNAVRCITLHHIMVLYRSLYLMVPNPFISYHEIVIFDTYVYSVMEKSFCAI